MEKIEFNVDEQYENEKGVFTVLSIHRDEMVIRWESGEELRTSIELQRNIQKRRLWEKLQKEAEEAARKNKAKAAKDKIFGGFQTTDFKVSASKTNWRGRNQLGGAVARKLPDTTFSFNSWAYTTKSELHWQDTARRKKDTDGTGARFFVRLNAQHLIYGFCVTRTLEQDESSSDWATFNEWIADEGGEEELHALALKEEMAVYNHAQPAMEGFHPAKKGWTKGDGKKSEGSDTLVALIKSMPEASSLQFEMAKKMDKIEAIARGKDIIEDLTELFTRLMPLYRGAVL